MSRAYPSEPLPFSLHYPFQGHGGLIGMLAGLTITGIGAIGLVMLGKYVQGFAASPGALAMIVLLTCTGTFSMYWVRDRIRDRAWKRAFFANNTDLDLNPTAIEKTIAWLNKRTKKRNTFEQVAPVLAIMIRGEEQLLELDPVQFIGQEWTKAIVYKNDILHIYHLFIGGRVLNVKARRVKLQSGQGIIPPVESRISRQ